MSWWRRATILDLVRLAIGVAICVVVTMQGKSCKPSCAERCASKGYTAGRDVCEGICECSGDTIPTAERSGGL